MNNELLLHWQPTCSKEALRARALMLEEIRSFFKERDVLEVETPLLCANAVTDLHIQAIPALYSGEFNNSVVADSEAPAVLHASSQISHVSSLPNASSEPLHGSSYASSQTLKAKHSKCYYLQTSPEFAMKRLLAAGSGSIYQLCKAFRNSERGHRHNPEFSMLEWYRLGFDHHQLMDEMDEFLQRIIGAKPARRFSYQALFLHYLNIDPHTALLERLKNLAIERGIHIAASDAAVLSKDDWLDLLMTHCIEPQLKAENLQEKVAQENKMQTNTITSSLPPINPTPVMIYDYPASQAALAKIRKGIGAEPAVAERFEVYIEGVELANGYHELSDGDLQFQRFQEDNEKRKARSFPQMEPDLRLVQALKDGFPSCAGVALGIDRLLMLKGNYKSIDEVLSFTIERA